MLTAGRDAISDMADVLREVLSNGVVGPMVGGISMRFSRSNSSLSS